MTKDEFDQIVFKASTAFPDLRKWIMATPEPSATLATWRECLETVDATLASRVISMMIAGDIPAPRGFEIQDTPRIIKREAGKLSAERRRKEESAHYQSIGRRNYVGHLDAQKDSFFKRCYTRAIEWGLEVKEGKLSRDENARRMAELTNEMNEHYRREAAQDVKKDPNYRPEFAEYADAHDPGF